ncbi:MAG: hypothetical protein IJ136_02535 [Erysipelotrichaceae bacterium]|nr:hypothetical protein [Erysipelotrichaceae bacterium]
MKCPNCNGTLYFDIPSQKLKCRNCESVFKPEEYEGDNSAEEDVIEGGKMYICQNCGAELISANDEAVSYCSYCGSEQILEGELTGVKKPKYIMPFRISKEECKKIYEKEVKGKNYVPKEFKDPQFIERFRPFYIPYWMYNIRFREDPFKISGHRHYTKGNYDYDEDYDVTAQLDETTYGVPFDASRNFDDTIAEHIAPFAKSNIKNYHPGYLAGMYADSPNVDARLYEEEVLEKASKLAVDSLENKLGGMSLDLPKKPKKLQEFLQAEYGNEEAIYLPVWFLTWRKNDRVAYAVVNGQSGKIHIDLPADLNVFSIYTAIGAALLFVLLSLFVSVTSRFVIWFSALLVYLVGRRYYSELRQIRNRENHVFDKGYLLSEEKELPMSEKKRNRLRKRVMNASFDFSAVMMGLCFVLAFIVFMFAGSFYDIAVSQMGALALTFIILILQSIRFVRQINVARYLRNKRSILVCILGMGSVVYAFMVAYLQPVEDWWYYLGSLICLVAASAMSIDLILRYNETSTRPLPSFYSRKGGDDRA